MPKKINEHKHPDYQDHEADWTKFRGILEGGRKFVDKNLVKFTHREHDNDYRDRKAISYVPGHAKSALLDIKNAINNRLVDVKRDGPADYLSAVSGELGGVDFNGNTMDGFLADQVLLEMLGMAKVGVFVDKQRIDTEIRSKADTKGIRPYLYTYKAEDILSWRYNNQRELQTVLLKNSDFTYDQEFGLPTGQETTYQLLSLSNLGVLVETFDADGEHLGAITLGLDKIPFVMFEISDSLLKDVADMQIALLNLASSDLNYALKSNFPFYIENYDPRNNLDAFTRQAAPDQPTYQPGDTSVTVNQSALEGQAAQAKVAKPNALEVGNTQGRRYAKGLDAPSFIHPSPEPLMASMAKQKDIQEEIRQIMNLTVSNILSRNASAESKRADETTKEEGLSQIGLELEHGERLILEIWHAYQRSSGGGINYPQSWQTRTDKDRRQEASELKELRPSVPSKTYQKQLTKEMVVTTIGHKVDNDTLQKIMGEIEAASVVETDPDVINQDHEAGFVGTETASLARGYPEGEVEKAKKDHAERAARILMAQSAVADDPANRGGDDLSNDNQAPEGEKQTTQSSIVKTGAEDSK
jgi:hypothetical protein